MPVEDIKQDTSTLKVEPNKPPSPGVVSGTVSSPPAQEKVIQDPIKDNQSDLVTPVAPVSKIPEKIFYSWKAPARPFKRRGRDFWVTSIAIAVVVGLILFAVEGFMPVILLIALVFLFYVMNSVKPETIEYKITNYGIDMAGKVTGWDRLVRFWFSKRFDSNLLIFETIGLSGRLELVVNDTDVNALKNALSKYLTEEEASPSYMDKTANWFSKKLPGNN